MDKKNPHTHKCKTTEHDLHVPLDSFEVKNPYFDTLAKT